MQMTNSGAGHAQPADDVTGLLRAWSGGDQNALQKLTPIVYTALRRLARRYMREERAGHTMQATALVNELYIRLVDVERVQWNDRAHFFAVSAQLMRRILVDRARRRNQKRGGDVARVTLDEALVVDSRARNLVALDDAMTVLSRFDARKARVIELRFFGGLSVAETAEVLQVSEVTVIRDWNFARAWLHKELKA